MLTLGLWLAVGAAGCEAEKEATVANAGFASPDAAALAADAGYSGSEARQGDRADGWSGNADAEAPSPNVPADDAGKHGAVDLDGPEVSEPSAADAGAGPPGLPDEDGEWGFRISSLQLRSPPLCYASTQSDTAGGCLNVEGEANALLSLLLDDPDEPLDLVGLFGGSPLGPRSILSFGAGSCVREEGRVTGCTLLEPSVSFEGITASSDTPCLLDEPERRNEAGVHIDPPCFVTEQAPLEVSLLGSTLDLRGARVAGTFALVDLGFDITGGHLGGFLPEEVARTLSMDLQTGSSQGSVTLADLLHAKARTSTADGVEGWELVLVFEAGAVKVERQ